jgi:hypothetical protein
MDAYVSLQLDSSFLFRFVKVLRTFRQPHQGAEWGRLVEALPVLIIQDAARIKGSAILDAEAVWLDSNGMADFEALHSRSNDGRATALAFDLLMLNEEDMRRKPHVERKAGNPSKACAQWSGDSVCGARRGARRKAFCGCLQAGP